MAELRDELPQYLLYYNTQMTPPAQWMERLHFGDPSMTL